MNGPAEVWNGLITYFNRGLREHVEFECLCVAVDGDAKKAIELCGYDAEWLPYEGSGGNRMYFIMGSYNNEDGTWDSLDSSAAEGIAEVINKVAQAASEAPDK